MITYNRNSENVVWENLRIVAELATGKYVWLCSDDEKYTSGVLKHIAKVAQKDIYKFIYLNIDQNFDNQYIKIFAPDNLSKCFMFFILSFNGVFIIYPANDIKLFHSIIIE